MTVLLITDSSGLICVRSSHLGVRRRVSMEVESAG